MSHTAIILLALAFLIGRRPEWWIRIFHRKPYETIIQQIRRETK